MISGVGVLALSVGSLLTLGILHHRLFVYSGGERPSTFVLEDVGPIQLPFSVHLPCGMFRLRTQLKPHQ